MTSLERTLNFINDRLVDRPPFHPIIMRFAAKHAGVRYRDFCLDPKTKCSAMVKSAEDFSLDWVTVMSDPYAETEAFGVGVEYPEDGLPYVKKHLDADEMMHITVPKIEDHHRLSNRLRELEEYRQMCGAEYLIVGWIEGPMAEYANLRGLSNACLDLIERPETISLAFHIIMEHATQFIAAQIQAGAHCIGIGDAVCSQIGPEFYRHYVFDHHRTLVHCIHSLGAMAKLHICGNTKKLLPDMIGTGADIIDIDHLVPVVQTYIPLLAERQVVSGNSDPVSIIQNGGRDIVLKSVVDWQRQTLGRGIVSAGCEITPETGPDQMNCFRDAVLALQERGNTHGHRLEAS